MWYFLLIITQLLVVNVCIAKDPDLAQFVQQLKAKKLPSPDPLPSFFELQVNEKFPEQAQARSLFSAMPNNGDLKQRAQSEFKNYLSNYSISKLRYGGILISKNMRWALIVLPKQLVVYAREGDTLGLEQARIKEILLEKLVLMITATDSGETLLKEMNVSLHNETLE